MKKVLVVLLALVMVFSLVACGGGGTDTDTDVAISKIILITDKGNIDDKSFNQGAWEGVVAFATENEIEHEYIKPEEASDAGYLAAIALAVEAGADVIVTPGFLFEVPIYEAQTLYPDVKFVLLDGAPHTADYSDGTIASNVASVFYAEEESGYLAGYAAVKDGFTKIGFMGGMAVPAVQAFGYGYLQGAEAAAVELGVDVSAVYHYTGNFEENDTNKATAKAMYEGGTELIFACGGSVGKSVMSAAAEAGAKVIGVDVDQRYDSETVITSATKGLGASVQAVLQSIMDGSFDTYAGTSTYFNAANDGVGLPTVVLDGSSDNAFDRFATFTAEDYDAVFATLVDGTVDPIRTIDIASADGYATADELKAGLALTKVSVEVR
ncbi:MAG: BMP family ABC transporter substrate-binding protein [Firmicutes bacterium]|nr:BMP family ABC transporter substrate-binding protein [Bacillota bacterium]